MGRQRLRSIRRAAKGVLALVLVIGSSVTAFAQLDPLLFIKRVPPTVIVVMDTSRKMLEDGLGRHYDTNTYTVSADAAVATALGVDTALATTYRRKYVGLDWDGIQDDNKRYTATNIIAVPNTSPEYATFWDVTRFEIAKKGIAQAVRENDKIVRWGLIKLRQDSPFWRVAPSCDKPVNLSGNAALAGAGDVAPCNGGGLAKYVIYIPSIPNAGSPNYGIETLQGGGAVVVNAAAGTAGDIIEKVSKPLLDSTGLIPGSRGGQGYTDRPLTHALLDAKKLAEDAMAADGASTRSCRNTIVVLIAGGKDSGNSTYMTSHDVLATASGFNSVTAGGVTRRVPIYVVGVKPDAADETQLQSIASNSGGAYFSASDTATVARAINRAVQTAFARPTDFDTSTTSEFTPVSPIVGTVNLKNGKNASGTLLPNTDIVASPGGQPIPQRSNVLITAGFTLPGFEGRLRAFRSFVPQPDSTKPSGWKFVKDGTRLWPDLDGRPQYAGLARTPIDPNVRNIYTYIPDTTGGGSVVAFTTANAATIEPHLGGVSAATLIPAVRNLSIGAIIGSTPALMDAPSLDPPPDDAYGRSDAAGTFAGTFKNRRSIIFLGANDGMIHAVDARTGYEVWAFIPYNLLPKLRSLVDGQPVEQFDYFVDSSPKVAEVKMIMPDTTHKWRSMLIIGQGPGGTFYQAFDVTEAGMGVVPDADDLTSVNLLLQQFDTPNESIVFKWAFPNYSSFDPTYTTSIDVADGTAGGKVKLFGDLKSTATAAEKTVGFTWSDPAVGPLTADRTVNVVITGSGYFPDIEDLVPARASGPRAGHSLYLLKIEDGTLLGNPAGSNCTTTSLGCRSVGDASNGRKNALQADPTAGGVTGSLVVTKAYLGDVDGRYWRFDFTSTGDITVDLMVDTGQPIYSSSALMAVGSFDQYMFFSTGSDLLPTTPLATGGTGTFKLYGLKDNAPATGATVRFTQSLASVTDSGGFTGGERSSTAPSVAGDIVFYTTTSESGTAPCSDFSANLYGLTFLGGAAYDSSGNNKIDTGENPVIRTVAGRATAPFIVDQHLYFGAAGAAGANIEAFGDPEDFNNGVGQVGVRILSWREIR